MTATPSPTKRRYELLDRLGLQPTVHDLVHAALQSAIEDAARRSPGSIAVLDAGCGRKSPLRRFRRRIARFVGVDIHAPAQPLTYLDEFATVDLCGPGTAFPEATFDVILSNFTLEHFADPPAALANLHRWLRPGGRAVLTTVNRRHPFVAAYLGLPAAPRHRLQPIVKASAADAHPLVGICNDPATIRRELEASGFTDVTLATVPNLARAWGRHLPTFALGAIGDLLAQSTPSRRSTIVATARRPDPQAIT